MQISFSKEKITKQAKAMQLAALGQNIYETDDYLRVMLEQARSRFHSEKNPNKRTTLIQTIAVVILAQRLPTNQREKPNNGHNEHEQPQNNENEMDAILASLLFPQQPAVSPSVQQK